MIKIFQILMFSACLVACSGSQDGLADWTKWKNELEAYYVEGPTAILKKTDYRYLPRGEVAHIVRRGGVVELTLNPAPGGQVLGSIRNGISGSYWKRNKELDGDLPASGQISGILKIDDRYSLVISIENITLDEKQTRIILFDDQSDHLSSFNGLSFFPFNPNAVISADFIAKEEIEPIILDTERGLTKRFFNVGNAKFEYENKKYELPLYAMTDQTNEIEEFFTGFTDGTSGKTSYGIGRYISIADIGDFPPETVSFDLNRLYNPSCARSDAYNCPLLGEIIDADVPYGESYNYRKN